MKLLPIYPIQHPQILPFFVMSCLLLIGACSEDRQSVEDFYFPVEKLKSPKVYEYRSLGNDSLAPQYWYYRTIETDTMLYFTGQSYNQDFIPEQFSREMILEDGVVSEDIRLYHTDSTGHQLPVEVELLAGNVFPFFIKDSSIVYLYKIKWYESKEPPVYYEVIKNRRYLGETSYTYKGKNIPCIQFQVREMVDYYNEGHLENEIQGIELYAEGIGLVYYKKMISEGLSLEYGLHDTYEMEELEEKFREMLAK